MLLVFFSWCICPSVWDGGWWLWVVSFVLVSLLTDHLFLFLQ
jgi:hypothetical protein